LDRSTAWWSSGRTNIGIEASGTGHGSVEIASCGTSDITTGVLGASGRASAGQEIVVSGESIITILSIDSINSTITTVGEFAGISAGGKRRSRCSIITFLSCVNITITTFRSLAGEFTFVGSVGIE